MLSCINNVVILFLFLPKCCWRLDQSLLSSEQRDKCFAQTSDKQGIVTEQRETGYRYRTTRNRVSLPNNDKQGIYIYYTETAIPQGSLAILCLYPWGHLDDTLAFKDHWSRDLHDSAERPLTFITIYKLLEREGQSNPGPSRMKISELNP